MKPLVAMFVILCSACSSSKQPTNLAAEQVLALEPDAKCTPVFTDMGETHEHSARCRLPTKAIIYCRLAIGAMMACDTLQPAPGQAQAPAPRKADDKTKDKDNIGSAGAPSSAPSASPATPPAAEAP